MIMLNIYIITHISKSIITWAEQLLPSGSINIILQATFLYKERLEHEV